MQVGLSVGEWLEDHGFYPGGWTGPGVHPHSAVTSDVELKPTAPRSEAAGSLRSPAALFLKRRG